MNKIDWSVFEGKQDRPRDEIWANWDKIFPPSFHKIAAEYSVYGALCNWQRDGNGWRIDYIAHYGKRFLIEAILGDGSNPWTGFKIYAYRAAYAIDAACSQSELGMMIFFNSKHFNQRLRNICCVSRIEYCVFQKDSADRWEVRESSLWGKDDQEM